MRLTEGWKRRMYLNQQPMNIQALLLALLVVVSFGVGFLVGGGSKQASMDIEKAITRAKQELPASVGARGSTDGASYGDAANAPASTGLSDDSTAGGTLTTEQRALAERFGVDVDAMRITPEMVSCAQTKIGEQRVEDIKNGGTPSFTEAVKLSACL